MSSDGSLDFQLFCGRFRGCNRFASLLDGSVRVEVSCTMNTLAADSEILKHGVSMLQENEF